MAHPESHSVFDCHQEPSLLEGLQEVTDTQGPAMPTNAISPNTDEKLLADSSKGPTVTIVEVSDRMFCSACQCPFESREEQTEHYRLDWHRFNLRQRLLGAQPTTAEEFESRTGAGDLSSISGSDSEDEGSDSDWGYRGDRDSGSAGTDSPPDSEVSTGRISCRVLFSNSKGQYLSVYRCILCSKKMESENDLAASLQKLSKKAVWVILMAGGGHFAGAVFQGRDILQHKTFHRYTVRAKRGTAQGLRDSQNRSHAPKSAGAALRRYNEAALLKDIQDLLESWANHLSDANAIFLRAPSYNRAMFFGGRPAPLERNDQRIRTLPFPTRRPTFREVKRVHEALSTLHVYGKDTDIANIISSPKKVWKKASKPSQKATSVLQINAVEEEVEKDCSGEESPAVELETVELSLSTLELKEFEICPRKKRHKKKKKQAAAATDLVSRESVEQREYSENPEPADGVEGPERSVAKRKPRRNRKAQAHSPEQGMGAEYPEYGLRDSLYTACKTGDVETLLSLLQPQGPGREDGTCPSVETHAPVTSDLLNSEIDPAGFTLLHVAAAAGHRAVIRLLLDAGSDPACRDKKGQTPYAVAAEKDTRNEFRKYMAENPNKYDYIKAQVPGPLTAEIESKKMEKKRAQKAAKKQREKEQREERKKQEVEEEEKRRYAALSDREKRAVAAERRLAHQMATSGGTVSNARRCWQCGESLQGKIPFEYLDFSFCTTRCLQEHRRSRAPTARP
ncbi:tRNA endonuclease ANKZF1 isoform X2 [Lepisosteus oculatus]|uniref:tRNA endonuclease ANKZF1 isoform X2 n=1 Tax=Lepisosteus oculatus TaxID=7918 RepID=UPI00073FE4E7|nr:PREDICTED: ankyrin repeat and zinc finger domain-containing protein 1 isoform X2 [Lepisosteus oculatus]